jgi:aminopeptidase N
MKSHKDNGGYTPDTLSSGRRALAGLALHYLCLGARRSGDAVWPGWAYQRVKDADNMTDRFAALSALVHSGHELAKPALAHFHQRFKGEELVLDKWFALQAGACDRSGQVLPAVRVLMKHPDFNLKNPNRARSLIFSFCNAPTRADFTVPMQLATCSGANRCWNSTPSTRRSPQGLHGHLTAGKSSPSLTRVPRARR